MWRQVAILAPIPQPPPVCFLGTAHARTYSGLAHLMQPAAMIVVPCMRQQERPSQVASSEHSSHTHEPLPGTRQQGTTRAHSSRQLLHARVCGNGAAAVCIWHPAVTTAAAYPNRCKEQCTAATAPRHARLHHLRCTGHGQVGSAMGQPCWASRQAAAGNNDTHEPWGRRLYRLLGRTRPCCKFRYLAAGQHTCYTQR